MNKTIKSRIHEARAHQELWEQIAYDKEALQDRDKTRQQALQLSCYYEGKVDAFESLEMEERIRIRELETEIAYKPPI